MFDLSTRVLNCRILPAAKLRFIVFVLYNTLYVAYMSGYASQTLYMGALLLFCGMNLFSLFLRGSNRFLGIHDLTYILFFIITFAAISLPIQIYHGAIRGFLFSSLGRLALPALNAFLFVNTVDRKDWNLYFNVFLIRFIINFIMTNLDNLTLANILSIDWADSEAATETSLAHDFLIIEMYFLLIGKRSKAAIGMVFCMLSMKRLSFILAPLFFFAARWVPKDRPVRPIYRNVMKMIIVLSPFVLIWMYQYDTMQWLYSAFHLDLIKEMSGRPTIYHTAVDGMRGVYDGYGSINNFLSLYANSHYGTVWNGVLHNDTIGMYLETGIVGIAVFAHCIVEFSSKSYWHFFMMVYLVFAAITSHILDYFSVWVTFYMIVMCTNALKANGQKTALYSMDGAMASSNSIQHKRMGLV